MTALVWDAVGTRGYESGVDKGVLYPPSGDAVPWNGLTSISENSNQESTPVYYDGMKINQLIAPGEFSATMRAVTYPDEFLELEGLAEITPGAFFANQSPQMFGLSYRTLVGSDTSEAGEDYKLHLLYNVLAVPHEKSYSTISADPSLTEFEWDIVAIPEEVPGYRPTAHIVVDSRDFDSEGLVVLESALYGSETISAFLPSMADVLVYVADFVLVRIVDNGDGTWTAIDFTGEHINMLGVGDFEINDVNATYLDDDTYTISDTVS